jgi:hypothetical protein
LFENLSFYQNAKISIFIEKQVKVAFFFKKNYQLQKKFLQFKKNAYLVRGYLPIKQT